MSKKYIIPIFIPHKGCPFDCIYCNQKIISGQIEDMTLEKMTAIVSEFVFPEKNNISAETDGESYVEIAFYGGSFTGIEKEEQIGFLKKANEYIKQNKVDGIRLSTRPDYINREILDYLKYYNVKTIELGVQSMDEEVLGKSSRGHSCEDVIAASNLIKEYEIELGIQTMIGLPGDTREKALYTAQQVILLKPKVVRIYPTLVIKGTFLEKMYLSGDYAPLSLDEAVDISAQLLDLYEKNDINVIRLGLQPTDSINESNDVVAGPFHPAFRQLAQAKLALNKIEKCIADNTLFTQKNIVIHTSAKNISNVIGQKRSNINYLKKKYNFDNIMVKDDAASYNEIYVTILT